MLVLCMLSTCRDAGEAHDGLPTARHTSARVGKSSATAVKPVVVLVRVPHAARSAITLRAVAASVTTPLSQLD